MLAVYIVTYWLLSLTALSDEPLTRASISVLTACLQVICWSHTLVACMLLLRTFIMFYFYWLTIRLYCIFAFELEAGLGRNAWALSTPKLDGNSAVKELY